MNRQAELHIMTKSAEKAALGLIRDFGELEKLQVSRKGFCNFVTSADRRTEEKLIYELSKSRPDFSFLCEESGIISKEDKEHVWVIDPIDGTTNFMRGIPYFAISIALVENGTPIAGITFNPMRAENFKASAGEGAFAGNRNRLRVSGREEFKESIIATRVLPEEDLKLSRAGCFLRRTGSTTLDLAHVASGNYDATIAKNVNFWDIATGILLIKESGGFVDYFKNSTGTYDIFAASSSKILKVIKDACAS